MLVQKISAMNEKSYFRIDIILLCCRKRAQEVSVDNVVVLKY